MKITITQYDNYCMNCPDRKVGCHNVETCSKWAVHEKVKEETYARRLQDSTIKAVERKRIRRFYEALERKRNG